MFRCLNVGIMDGWMDWATSASLKWNTELGNSTEAKIEIDTWDIAFASLKALSLDHEGFCDFNVLSLNGYSFASHETNFIMTVIYHRARIHKYTNTPEGKIN